MKRRNLFTNIDHNSYQDGSDKNIQKKTHRKRTNTDKFSDKMKPSDKNTNKFLCCGITMIVPKIVRKMIERSFQVNCRELSNQNNCQRKNKRSRKIRIYRTKVVSEPLVPRNEREPIIDQSHNISQKNYDDETTEKPDISLCYRIITDQITRIEIDTIHYIESKSPQSRKFLSPDSQIQKSNKHKKHAHEYPSRKNRIRDMKPSDRPIFDRITFRRRDVRSLLLCVRL